MERSPLFDYVRLAGALLVLVGHAYVLLGRDAPALAGSPIHHLGVILFFLVSGYLIAGSWEADPHFWPYAEKRVRRIMPALLVVVGLTVFVLGPAMTSAPRFFHEPKTWTYLWRNSLLLAYDRLPGVFDRNPLPAVNGSLWTLPVEVMMYVLTPLMVRGGPWLCGAAAAALLFHPVTGRIGGFGFAAASSLIPFFLIGAALRLWGVRMPRSRAAVLPVDLSYGIYLTAWPVEQTLVALVPGLTPVGLVGLTLAATLPLATASWLLIERPALRRRTSAPETRAV